MKTMNITNFKAHALKVINLVFQNHENVIIKKKGKPVAEIIPYKKLNNKNMPGKLAETKKKEKDIISPLGEEIWEACQ